MLRLGASQGVHTQSCTLSFRVVEHTGTLYVSYDVALRNTMCFLLHSRLSRNMACQWKSLRVNLCGSPNDAGCWFGSRPDLIHGGCDPQM